MANSKQTIPAPQGGQLSSKYARHGARGNRNLIAQIHFKYGSPSLDANDRAVLDWLVTEYARYLLAHKMNLQIVGHADSRGSVRCNQQLALRRATAVKRYLDARLGHYRLYSSVVRSEGEKDPSGKHGFDRRVDVFSSWVPPKPPMVLTPVRVTGVYRGRLSKKFKFRVLIGAGVGIGPLAGQVISIQIKNSRTGATATYTYTGAGSGFAIGISRPTAWEEKTIPYMLDVGDFVGSGKVTAVSAGVKAGVLFTFSGPKDRKKSSKDIDLTFNGWDLNIGFQGDAVGYWHRRD